MGEILGQVLSDILGSTEILVFAWGICQVKLTKDWKRWAAAGLLWIVGAAVVYSGFWDEMVAFPIKLLETMVIIVFLLMQGKVIHRIIKYWFSFSYVDIIFQPIYFLITFFGGFSTNLSWGDRISSNLASVLNICVLLLLAKLIQKRKQWIAWIQSIPMKYYILGIFCGFSAGGLKNYMGKEIAEFNLMRKIFFGILTNILYLVLYFLGIGFAFINLLREQYYKESSLKSNYLRMAQEHYNELADHMHEVRSIRHDIRAHVNALEYLIQKGNTADAMKYLHEIKVEIDGTSHKTVDIGNNLVNAVLANELEKVGSEITFQVEGCLPDTTYISDFDLCVIFSNLLSNAVESCKRCSNKKEKTVFLEIKTMDGNLLIGMRNSVEGQISWEQLGTYTSKKDTENHGYGIYNVRKTVEKYGGDIDFEIDNGIFAVKICFYQEN